MGCGTAHALFPILLAALSPTRCFAAAEIVTRHPQTGTAQVIRLSTGVNIIKISELNSFMDFRVYGPEPVSSLFFPHRVNALIPCDLIPFSGIKT
jgi:hypothetical protein